MITRSGRGSEYKGFGENKGVLGISICLRCTYTDMHWPVSLSLLCSSLIPFIAGGFAQPTAGADKHYAIMDNDWYTAGFVPYLIALDGGIEVLALASGLYTSTILLFSGLAN